MPDAANTPFCKGGTGTCEDCVGSCGIEEHDELRRAALLVLGVEKVAADNLLDWVGVAGGLPLAERVRLLCIEYVSRTGQMSADEAMERTEAILNAR